jgi:hypothetical protein
LKGSSRNCFIGSGENPKIQRYLVWKLEKSNLIINDDNCFSVLLIVFELEESTMVLLGPTQSIVMDIISRMSYIESLTSGSLSRIYNILLDYWFPIPVKPCKVQVTQFVGS